MFITSFVEKMHAATFDPASPARPKFPISRSFTRLESPSREQRPRSRASTLQFGDNPTIFEHAALSSSPTVEAADPVETYAAKDRSSVTSPIDDGFTNPSLRIPQTYDELPVELKSLTERFLDSLFAKAHPTPVNIDSLGDMFQDFYVKAETNISTHIAAISSKLSRERSNSSIKSARSSKPSSPNIGTSKEQDVSSPSIEQRMLSADEMLDRRKARRLLEVKRTALEELIERSVCEKVYDKIWRHRTSDDEERDQTLRSKIAALSLIGIGLKELLAGADEIPDQVRAKTVEEQDRIRTLLAPARQCLRDMNEEKYPLGKMHQLSATHKNIVETLSQLFPSTSSADEVLPTLIYALMTSSPEHCNVISDLRFVQRFRAASKVDGEAAYCMVNLEASISFLETVDLSSLRADELPQGPEKTGSRPGTPLVERTPMELGIAPVTDLTTSPGRPLRPLPSPTKSSRRLSNLITAQTNRFEAASDSLRTSVLNGADEAFDTINNTLENSFKFLFGRLREQQALSPAEAGRVMPKTLEEARKLVSTPPPAALDDEAGSINSGMDSEDPLGVEPSQLPRVASGDRMLELVGGRRSIRDRSVDSSRSGASRKSVSFVTGTSGSTLKPVQGLGLGPTSSPSSIDGGAIDPAQKSPVTATALSAGGASTQQAGAIESMRNLGNTLNPLNQFAKIGFFGRTVSGGSHSIPTTAGLARGQMTSDSANTASSEKATESRPTSLSRIVSGTGPAPPKTSAEVKTLMAVTQLRNALHGAPPTKKFVDAKDASDLRIGDVEELLKEYQRLLSAVGNVIAP